MARTFNGTNQRLSLGSAVKAGRPVTMACWFRADNITANHTLMCLGVNATANFARFLSARGDLAGDPVRASESGSVGADGASTSTSYSAATWHHACGVFSTNVSRTAYLNGGGKITNTTAVTLSGIDRTSLGAQFHGGAASVFLAGRLAEAAIWDVALTDVEISVLAAGYSPRFVRPASLLAYWPLIGDTDPEDDVINGFDLTLVNAPTQSAHPTIIYLPTALSSLAFSNLSSVTASGKLSSNVPIQFTPSAAAIGSGQLVGASELVFGAATTLLAIGQLSGSAGVFFADTGTLSAGGQLAGLIQNQFTVSGSTGAESQINGNSLISFVNSSSLVGAGSVAGVVNNVFTASASPLGAGQLSGSAQSAFTMQAGLQGISQLASQANLLFGAQGDLRPNEFMSGSCSLILSANSTIQGEGRLQGEAQLSLLAQAITTDVSGVFHRKYIVCGSVIVQPCLWGDIKVGNFKCR